MVRPIISLLIISFTIAGFFLYCLYDLFSSCVLFCMGVKALKSHKYYLFYKNIECKDTAYLHETTIFDILKNHATFTDI